MNSFSCVLYNEEAETCTHFFLECSFAQVIWLQSSHLRDYRFSPHVKFIDVMEAAVKILPSPFFDTLCIACWMIWKCINKLVFNNYAPSYKDLWSRADLYRMEFMEMQERNMQVGGNSTATWKLPRSNSIHKEVAWTLEDISCIQESFFFFF